MAKPRIKWNNAGFVELLKADAVAELVGAEAQKVADRAGDGYTAGRGPDSHDRSRAYARASTGKAIYDNARNATLLRALGR